MFHVNESRTEEAEGESYLSDIPGELEKSSHFKKFIAPRVPHKFEIFKF